MSKDKIREEFEKYDNKYETKEGIHFANEDADYTSDRVRWERRCGFHAGYKARDKEVERLLKLLIEARDVIELIGETGRDKDMLAVRSFLETLKELE